jgi:dolichol-phosphate mannosyltransferase
VADWAAGGVGSSSAVESGVHSERESDKLTGQPTRHHPAITPLIVIPTYNERPNLTALLPIVLEEPRFHVLVVDDNSPDGTAELVQETALRYPSRLHLLSRPAKLGLGTAYLAGFRWALDRDYDLVCEMDADFSHDPRTLPRLVNASATADLVLGSRYVVGGGTANWSVLRQVISRTGSLYARSILGLPYQDLTGGFKCFRRRVLETIDLDSVHSTGYAFQIELTYRAHRAGFRIAEVPIVFEERRAGSSKMSPGIVGEALVRVAQLRFARCGSAVTPEPSLAVPPSRPR